MDLLPDEMLDMVFQYVSTPELVAVCARVCSRWQRIVERRALALRDEGDERRLHRVSRAVLLTTFPVDLTALLDGLAARAVLLRELTAHAPAPFHEPHVQALSLLPHLRHLDVFTSPRLLNERMAPVAKRLRTLVANEHLAPGLLRELAAGSQLVALHMFGRAVHFPPRDMLAVLRARAPHLRELTLRCNELPDAAYETIGSCHELRQLRLYSCWLLTGAGAAAVCRPRSVRLLHVTGAKLLRSKALAGMLADLPERLYELVLSNGWFGDEHVKILANRVPELRVLEVWRCKLSVKGLKALASALPRLEELDLDMTLSNRHLRALAKHSRLRQVRCIPDDAGQNPLQYMEDHPVWTVKGLKAIATYAPYASKYFRAGGEGFRSGLFYFWTLIVPLEPLPPYTGCNFEPYDEPFY